MNRASYPIHNVLVVVAHPDDAEFMCGGTVAKMAVQGKEVSLLVVTSGEKGGDGSVGEDELGRIRPDLQPSNSFPTPSNVHRVSLPPFASTPHLAGRTCIKQCEVRVGAPTGLLEPWSERLSPFGPGASDRRRDRGDPLASQ